MKHLSAKLVCGETAAASHASDGDATFDTRFCNLATSPRATSNASLDRLKEVDQGRDKCSMGDAKQ